MYVDSYWLYRNKFADGHAQYLVYCGWLLIELAFVLSFVIETKGRTLEETAALFDGERPQQDLVQRGGEAATMNMDRVNAFKDAHLATNYMELSPVSAHPSDGDDSASTSDPQAKERDSLDHPYYIEAV